ncbi:MAG: thiamine-monophosphate kinase [Planctomycetes bacterium]|nr:thiamine-monophosphate kinase [Planctomycetota bacterium]
MTWNEDRVHRWLSRELAPRGLSGAFGSDAAKLSGALRRPVICVDQTIEGVHCAVGTEAELVGRKAAARALSDLAASAARPVALVLAMALDPATDEAWIRRAIRAVQREARLHGAELVGGDLAQRRGRNTLVVTALGDGQGAPVGRERARAGDVVLVTGPVGGSLLGRHLTFEPRVDAGLWLARNGARALMDVTDGLARDLARLARASSVRIDLERVPIHSDARRLARKSGRSAFEHALHDGEDYELLATLSKKLFAALEPELGERLPDARVIGRVRRGAGLWLPASERESELVRWHGRGGYVHGG